MKPEKLTFAGRKHTAESNKKRSDTIKKMYADGVAKFGFKEKYTTDEQRTQARKVTRLKNRYGLSQDQFNQMLEDQDGTCAICTKPAVVVDHDHSTGLVRGILCPQCNSGLGFFGDNAVLLSKAAEYLDNKYEE